VHEGSPIIVGDEDQTEEVGNNATYNNRRHWNNGGHKQPSSSGNGNIDPTKKFKLQTSFVIGRQAAAAANRNNQHQLDDEDSLDAMMTDDAMHDDIFNTHSMYQQHQNNDIPSQTQQHIQPPNEYQSFQQQTTSHIHHMPPPSTAPLVVIDGANIAYNYAESLNPSLSNQHRQLEPNPKGITIAIQYFLKHHCRVQAVVPISWYKSKPRPGDHACSAGYKGNLNQRDDAKMITDEVEELRTLRQHGFLVACPPSDDDDAYAIALARREEDRLPIENNIEDDGMMMDDEQTTSCLPLGGYVVSNDFFHDAVRRDERQQKHHIEEHQHHQPGFSSLSQQTSKRHALKAWLKQHRISYSFANVGLVSQVNGGVELEFLPNPRNELIEAIDAHRRFQQTES
jgi:hypothetical protein